MKKNKRHDYYSLFLKNYFSEIIKNKITRRAIIFLLIIGNIVGAIFGFTWWYGEQLLRSPFYLWIIVAPCPVYASLFVVCFLMILVRIKVHNFITQLLLFVTSTGLIKYGIWTVFFWLSFPMVSNSLPLYIIFWLVVSHLVMAAESFILIKNIKTEHNSLFILLSLVWFLTNDFFHYWRGGITNKIEIPNLGIVSCVALFLTLSSPFVVFLIIKLLEKNNNTHK